MSDSGQLRSASTARLVLRGGVPRVVEITALPFTIGRSAGCSLQLEHASISREHAVLERDEGGFSVRDLGSRHGTAVNRVAISTQPHRLRHRDEILLGGGGGALIFEEPGHDPRSLTLLTANPNWTAGNQLERLTLFLQAAQSLSSYGALEDVLSAMLEYTLRLTDAERGFVFLGAEMNAPRLALGRDRQGTTLTDFTGVSRSVLREAALSRRDFLIDDVTMQPDATGQESLQLHAIRSVAAIPLRGAAGGQLLGLLYLDSQSARHNFGRTDQAILQAIARQSALLLENFLMLEREREAALLRKELEIATAIQRQILPQQLPEVSGVRIDACSIPCTGVGGDFYDVIPMEDGFVAVVADVCGKGMPAALLAAVAQGMMHAQVRSGVALGEAVDAINRFIWARSAPEKYLTLLALRYWPRQEGGAEVEVVNGGHVVPIVVRAGGDAELHADGDMPVGLLESASFHASRLELYPGDRMIVLSDGITEAEDAEGVQFGESELLRVLAAGEPLPRLFEALEQFTGGHPATDDRTVLTIQRVC